MGTALGVTRFISISLGTDLCNTDFCRSERPGQQKSNAQDHTTQALHLLWNYMNGSTEVSTSAYLLQTKPLGSHVSVNIPGKYIHQRNITHGGIVRDAS